MDKLTDAFEKGNRAAMKKFDKEVLDPTAHPRYEARLQSLIDKEEADVLKDNSRKTVFYYHQTLPDTDQNSATYVSYLKDKFVRDK